MLGREPAGGGIERADCLRGRQKGFEQRGLAVLVEVRLGLGDRLGQVLAEAGVVVLEAAPGRGDHDAAGRGKLLHERRACRGRVDDGDGSVDRLEPFGQVARGKVGPAKIEPGHPAVEGAMADQDQPQRGGRLLGLFRQTSPGVSRDPKRSRLRPGRWRRTRHRLWCRPVSRDPPNGRIAAHTPALPARPTTTITVCWGGDTCGGWDAACTVAARTSVTEDNIAVFFTAVLSSGEAPIRRQSRSERTGRPPAGLPAGPTAAGPRRR